LKTVVVLPTYNEAENLPRMVDALLSQPVADLTILVVDDNSPDGTGKLADDLSVAFPGKVAVLHRPGKQGLGRAYVAGFKRALEMGADYIVEMDSDFSHPAAAVPQMVAKMAEYDVVVGSRYVRGGSVDKNWSFYRKALSWWGSRVYAPLILGLSIHDATGGFKCFRRAALGAIDLDAVRSNGYTFQVEMNYICHRKGFRIFELPFHFEDRTLGKSKMNWRISVEAMWRVWQIRFRH
jgi:dolichol-phosphate mannosyltransferase